MNISLTRENTRLVLDGVGLAAPVRGCRLLADTPTQGKVRLEILLEGSESEVAAWLDQAQQLSEGGARAYATRSGSWAYLEVQTRGLFRTPLAGVRWGYLEGAAGPVPGAKGRAGMTLTIDRPDWWETVSEVSQPLSNRRYPGWAGALVLDNAGNGTLLDNSARLDPAMLRGDQPAPARLRLSGTAGAEVFIGHIVEGDDSYTYQLEAEAASPGAGVGSTVFSNQNGCSGASSRAVSWTGAAQTVLMQWTLAGTEVAHYRGKMFRPVLRLSLPFGSAEKVWIWFRSGYWNGTALEGLYDGEGILLPTNSSLVICPPIPFPAWQPPPAGITQWEPAALQCMAQAAGSVVTRELNVDFVQLVALDSWVHFLPLVSGIAPLEINYDGTTGSLSRFTRAMNTHLVEGPGIHLEPGKRQRLFVLNQAVAAAITQTVTLEVRARERRRTI